MYYKEATIQDLLEECANILMENSEEYELFPKKHSHDKLFRDILENPVEFKKFMNDFIDQNLGHRLESNEIEAYNKRFITTNYTGLESDIVFKIKEKPIYFLVEHQSKIEKNMSLRIFNYVTELIKEDIRGKTELKAYPKVIPIVLYTGSKKWNAFTNYKNNEIKIRNYDKNFIDISYEVIDINQYTVEELLKKKTIISYAMMIEKSKKKEELLDTITKIGKVASKEDTDYILRIIRYLLNPTLEEEAIEKLIQNFKEKGVIAVPNVFERILEQEKIQARRQARKEGRAKGIKEGIKEGKEVGIREGMKEGIKEGRKEGEKQAKKQVIENMVLQGLTVEKIAKYIGISEKEVQKIKGESTC